MNAARTRVDTAPIPAPTVIFTALHVWMFANPARTASDRLKYPANIPPIRSEPAPIQTEPAPIPRRSSEIPRRSSPIPSTIMLLSILLPIHYNTIRTSRRMSRAASSPRSRSPTEQSFDRLNTITIACTITIAASLAGASTIAPSGASGQAAGGFSALAGVKAWAGREGKDGAKEGGATGGGGEGEGEAKSSFELAPALSLASRSNFRPRSVRPTSGHSSRPQPWRPQLGGGADLQKSPNT